MKKSPIGIRLLCVTCMFVIGCAVESCSTKRKSQASVKKSDLPECNYPAGLPIEARREFDKQYEQGFKLYMQFCSSCHGPNAEKSKADSFTDAQLLNYNLRSGTEHMALFRKSAVSEGELSFIMTFLRYRR